MTGKSKNQSIHYFQDASHLCTVCAWEFVHIDQFDVFCWLLVSPICMFIATFFVIF